MQGFSYKSGKTYAEFRPGDKIAQYGLAALIGGGAGAAAVKLGLFGALWKFIAKRGKALVLLVCSEEYRRGFGSCAECRVSLEPLAAPSAGS
jgi:uncharacterized membrane-anchored protein